jgi:hypothetical protein
MITVEIEERFDLMGYAYFEEPQKYGPPLKGRVRWQISGTTLSLSPSWGLPSDAAMAAIKKEIGQFCRNPKREAPSY